MLVFLYGTPMWPPENNVNICNLLWLSGTIIIYTEKINIEIGTFPNTTSLMAKIHEINA